MKKLLNIIKNFRLYGISASIIWYIIGLSIKYDLSKTWDELLYTYSLTSICVEYFLTSILTILILSYFFEYIIKNENK